MRELPTEFGTVIGWAKFFKGRTHFFSATLSGGVHGNEYLWFVCGEQDPYSPEKLIEEFSDDYVYVGLIEVDADMLDRAVVLDKELNKD